MVPFIGVSLGLSTVTLPSPVDLSVAAGTPGQNQEGVRALPVGAVGIGGWSLEPYVAATGAGWWRDTTMPATTKAATAATTRKRRTKVLMPRCSGRRDAR